MILGRLFRPEKPAQRRLYEAIVAAARHPTFYAEWHVADSVDGRFDMIALHLFLVLDRLRGQEEALRQKLVDEFFADMDRSLREMGVGDLSVGKKVRKMAEAFYGRLAAYDRASAEGESAMEQALQRNVYPESTESGTARRLAEYVVASGHHLAGQKAPDIASGTVIFPEPRT